MHCPREGEKDGKLSEHCEQTGNNAEVQTERRQWTEITGMGVYSFSPRENDRCVSRPASLGRLEGSRVFLPFLLVACSMPHVLVSSAPTMTQSPPDASPDVARMTQPYNK